MQITISFLRSGYTLQFGHNTGISSQSTHISFIKEYYDSDTQSVWFAKMLFSI